MPPAAREHLRRGLELFDQRRFPAAIEELEQGYQIDPDPVFLYSLGQAHRMAGDCERAVRSYGSFLETSPPEVQANAARENIERCRRKIPKHLGPRTDLSPVKAPAPPTERPL